MPSLVPILGIPISAADTVVLTKNQALMVYRLALAFGAPPEFQSRMMEITPVIGAAVVWRQVAGGLVGLVPGYGILPKTAVAYAGTYITGRAAELWYATGLVSKADLRTVPRRGDGQGPRGDGADDPPGARGARQGRPGGSRRHQRPEEDARPRRAAAAVPASPNGSSRHVGPGVRRSSPRNAPEQVPGRSKEAPR